MTEGMAGSWSSTFYQVCEGRTAKYGTWADFKVSFRQMFIPVDGSIIMLNKINRLKQKGDLNSYVTEFCALVAIANVKESHILVHLFNLGLNNHLLCAIHMMGDIPSDFDKYLAAVMKIDSNINQGNTTISLTNTN
jgi:hypothetical protein